MGHVIHTLRRSTMESISGEIVRAKVLAVVIWRHVVDVNLITLLDVVEEEMGVSQIEDHFFHSIA